MGETALETNQRTNGLHPKHTAVGNMYLPVTRKTLARQVLASNLFLNEQTMLLAAVDGKTSKQSFDENGDPEILLNVFIHDLKLYIMLILT
ncbi:hypothetical protein FACS189454_04140 [Planctomycetales bacterium]|nr:hypothetical protein FACS189454_04140 [Planctomycetales bacterium]